MSDVSNPQHGLRRWWAAALAAAVLAAAGCGHAIRPGVPFNHAPRYDFLDPPACPEPAAGDDIAASDANAGTDVVEVRYLGAAGLWIAWRGEAILTAPFFSNPGFLRLLGNARPKEKAVRRGLAGLPLERAGAVLAGHGHYDHVGDLPLVAELAPRATLWVNRSAANALSPYRLGERLHVLEEHALTWTRLTDAVGRPLPFRVMAVPSDHAPHALGVTVFDGESRGLERTWERQHYWALKTGRTYALVIDLLDDDVSDPDEGADEGASHLRSSFGDGHSEGASHLRNPLGDGHSEGASHLRNPLGDGHSEGASHLHSRHFHSRFRILYQDSASLAPGDLLPQVAAPGAYDLAVVCMPSAQFVQPYPQPLLATLAPRHVLVTHYESFFSRWGAEKHFAPLLTGRLANSFLRRVVAGLEGVETVPPATPPCGPSADGWTMPRVGETIRFAAAPE